MILHGIVLVGLVLLAAAFLPSRTCPRERGDDRCHLETLGGCEACGRLR